MENKDSEIMHDVKDIPEQAAGSAENNVQIYLVEPKDGIYAQEKVHPLGEVNMEAAITSDDVIRAGGFGARDDINSFLPVASDSTDFEASLMDARNYEESQEEPHRPGLGWTEATASD
ncbi:hypothetical protein Nepgr_009988 [Nepenthes gracilis]|uniref:Uncharacterized protein n=1 Tax=Nepenthes gracilis TaxID=150966 RepID=A0AAD3SBH7_NEPGR|nr:hypothetical protein Nepgr_009988 [Nepenthes gracilis]